MTTVITWLALAFVVSALSSSQGEAATVTASSCSTASVQAAITAAADGDTVVIPVGSCTWTSGIAG